MPSDNFKILAQARCSSLTAGAAGNAFLDVTDSHEAIIKGISVVNTDSSARWFKGFVTTGTTYDDTTAITPEITIPAGGMAVFSGTITLAADNKLAWDVEVVDKITITVFGDEIDIS
jgi:hypothetical protein